jgi:hypothetical protein
MTFKVNRELPEGRYKLHEIFSGLENVEALRKCVGNISTLNQILEQTEVTLATEDGYMYVNDEDGSLVVGLDYLRNGDPNHLYLDVIHELVHVKQYLQGKDLFDRQYSYVDRPTEIEAYRCCVEEGRKIGMREEALAEYLYVEWITRKDHARLLRVLGVKAVPS